MDNDIVLRIKEIMNKFGLNQTSFSEKVGLKQPNLSKILSGERPCGEAIVNKITLSFDINKNWLLTGEGNMLKEEKKPVLEAVLLKNPMVISVPLVSQYAYAGYLSGFADEEYIDTLPVVPFFGDHAPHGEYMAFEVRGDSMDNGTVESLIEGDILICRKVSPDLWRYKLHIRKWNFVIVHQTDGIIVKRIVDHDVDKGLITVHSLNPEYEDKVIELNDVAQIFNVVQVSRSGRI